MSVLQSSSSIATERKGYGRGLILGLTVAETFVLLVFCLLLLVAAAITAERRLTAQANADRDALTEQLERVMQEAADLRERERLLAEENAQLAQVLAALPEEVIQSANIEEDWRELQLAREVARAVADAGLSAADALMLLPALKVLTDHAFLDADAADPAARLSELLRQADEAQHAKPHSWPPIINLSEAAGYYFSVGSAELSQNFRDDLDQEIAPEIAGYLAVYDVHIVEVIGHTDEQPVVGVLSNFDQTVQGVLSGDAPLADIQPGDNAGLGLARAIAVADVLRFNPQLAGATILPLSAAQLIMPGDVLTDGSHPGDVESRRRIEIRIRGQSLEVVPGGEAAGN